MTDLQTATDLERTVERYLEAYSEPDATRRAELIAQVWAPDGRLVDPPIDGAGHDGINQMITTVLSHYPGHTFRRASGIDAHHAFARYEWELVAPDGSVALNGIDVSEVGEDGRLVRVVGFMGPIPQMEANA